MSFSFWIKTWSIQKEIIIHAISFYYNNGFKTCKFNSRPILMTDKREIIQKDAKFRQCLYLGGSPLLWAEPMRRTDLTAPLKSTNQQFSNFSI